MGRRNRYGTRGSRQQGERGIRSSSSTEGILNSKKRRTGGAKRRMRMLTARGSTIITFENRRVSTGVRQMRTSTKTTHQRAVTRGSFVAKSRAAATTRHPKPIVDSTRPELNIETIALLSNYRASCRRERNDSAHNFLL